MTNAEILFEIVKYAGYDPRRSVGRIAFDTNRGDEIVAIVSILQVARDEYGDSFDAISEAAKHAKTDVMGFGSVVYFPDVKKD